MPTKNGTKTTCKPVAFIPKIFGDRIPHERWQFATLDGLHDYYIDLPSLRELTPLPD